MAYDIPGQIITLEASGDLSAHQYKFMTVDANGRAALCGADGNIVGVLQNKPSALGQAAEVMINGVTKIVGSASLAPGVIAASDAAGLAKTAAVLGVTGGVILVNPGAASQIGTMYLARGHFAAS